MRYLKCKQSSSEWFNVKCSILKKLAKTELFTVVVNGTTCLMGFNTSKSFPIESYYMEWSEMCCLVNKILIYVCFDLKVWLH